MHKFSFLILSILIFSACSNKPADRNCKLPNIPVNVTINLNNPQYINLQVPGGWAYVDNSGIKGLIIYNLNGSDYRAYDRACPHLSPSKNCSKMVVQNGIKIICPCDNTEFNILNGAPLTTGISCGAWEYRATQVNTNTLIITNF